MHKEPKHLDVILNGIGDNSRITEKRSTNTSWRGEITSSSLELTTEEVVQQVAMPEAGLANVRLRGLGSIYQLEITTVSGTVLPKPQIFATGENLVLRFSGLTVESVTNQTSSLDLLRPGRIPQPTAAPSLRSRAVAPPLGDISMGSMLIENRSFVQLNGPPVTLNLNNAPAKNALMSLARLGGYGIVYVDSSKKFDQGQSSLNGSSKVTVTMSFRDKNYAKAMNSVLMASGLQAKLDGAHCWLARLSHRRRLVLRCRKYFD